MITREITIDESKRVIFNSELFDRISGGKSRYELPFKEGFYLGGFTKGILRCVGMIYDYKDYQSIHINITKKHRARLGIIFGENLLKYTLNKPLLTNIPPNRKDVIRFVRHFNFHLVGKFNDQLIYKRDAIWAL